MKINCKTFYLLQPFDTVDFNEFLPKALKLGREFAEQCFENYINSIPMGVPVSMDYIDKVFGRTWFFCKCKKDQVAKCESAFSETMF